MEKVFYQTLATAQRLGMLKRSHLNKVNVDTIVQEKAIALPTDARLYHKMLGHLVKEAKARGIKLRQSYKRLGKEGVGQTGLLCPCEAIQAGLERDQEVEDLSGPGERRRSAVEPKIGHLKADNRRMRNHLSRRDPFGKGKEGDRINALLSGCGANLRKLLVAFSFILIILKRYLDKSVRLAGWSGTLHPYLARVKHI